MTIKEKRIRLDELYQEAVDRFVDKTDWQMWQWLEPEEQEEYEKLQKELGEI